MKETLSRYKLNASEHTKVAVVNESAKRNERTNARIKLCYAMFTFNNLRESEMLPLFFIYMGIFHR